MAKNTTVNKTKVALEFELDQQDHDVLAKAAGDSGLLPFLKSCAEAYFHEYSNGGLMLSGNEVSVINKASDKPVTSSEEVVNLVEKSQKTSKGNKKFEVTLDPALIESFQGVADFLGLSIEEFVNSCWAEIHANGWLYQMQPDVRWVPFSAKEVAKIKQSAKTDVLTSADILEVVRKANA